MLGKFIAQRRLRDRVVLATKFAFSADPANPNAGGNGRRNIGRAIPGVTVEA
jgi:aryl-alcohol dehydrogenase-like predicted oxidoreductase